MSRCGLDYNCCDDDPLLYGRWRGQVASAIRGKRGQKLLRDMLAALDAMPEKRLIAGDLITDDGCVCALGAVGLYRGVDLFRVDPEDRHTVANMFDIAPPLACEIMYENDEGAISVETPEMCWKRMRAWVASQIME